MYQGALDTDEVVPEVGGYKTILMLPVLQI
jgi:hypothetical protein